MDPYDRNAVACLIYGRKVGYTDRNDAPRLQDLLIRCERSGQAAMTDGYIVGGWSRWRGKDQGHYGVKLNIEGSDDDDSGDEDD